jgi:hypothetical protein
MARSAVRTSPRLALLFLGAVLARGRRTVTSWICAAELIDQLQVCYTAVAVAGKKAEAVAAYLVTTVVKPLVSGVERLTIARDNTPTRSSYSLRWASFWLGLLKKTIWVVANRIRQFPPTPGKESHLDSDPSK